MRKILSTFVMSLVTLVAVAGNWEGPCGVYLLVNGNSQNYRLTDVDWKDNSITEALNNRLELNDVDLGTIKTLVLCGGQMTAGANGNDYYDTNSFRVQYRVYKEGETAPDTWQELALDEETYRSGDDYRYEATGKTIDLRALTDGRGGIWKLEAKMLGHKYWNSSSGSGSWDTNHDPQTASFYMPEHYYVAGNGEADVNNSWCGGTDHNWWKDYSGNEIVSGSKTFTNVAAGNYEFKVTNGYWNDEYTTCNEYTYDDLNTTTSDANVYTTGSGKGLYFSTDAPSDITVSFDAVTGKITITSTLGRFVRLPYSVVGDPLLGLPIKDEQWDVTSTATEMTRQDDGTYRFTIQNIDLEAHSGRKFKIVGGHSWSVYQAPAEGDFTVDIPVAGIYDLVFDFDPATNLATCTPKFHQNVTISAYQFSTFYNDKAFDVPEGLTAYIFTGIENEMLVMESINPIPANTGVLLYGAANQAYELMQTTTDATYPLNLLKGTLTDTEISNSNVHYILSLSDANEFGFFWPYGATNGVGDFENKAGKAYIELPGGGASAPMHIRGFILAGPQVATGIYEANADESEHVCYDLLGRPVNHPQQGGVYIINKKKVIIF